MVASSVDVAVRDDPRAARCHISRIAKHAQPRAPTTNLILVSRARHVAARIARRGVVLERVPAVAFLRELDARHAVVVGAAEGLARFDGHAGRVGEGAAGEGAPGRFVHAADVGPAGVGGAGDGGEGGG